MLYILLLCLPLLAVLAFPHSQYTETACAITFKLPDGLQYKDTISGVLDRYIDGEGIEYTFNEGTLVSIFFPEEGGELSEPLLEADELMSIARGMCGEYGIDLTGYTMASQDEKYGIYEFEWKYYYNCIPTQDSVSVGVYGSGNPTALSFPLYGTARSKKIPSYEAQDCISEQEAESLFCNIATAKLSDTPVNCSISTIELEYNEDLQLVWDIVGGVSGGDAEAFYVGMELDALSGDVVWSTLED